MRAVERACDLGQHCSPPHHWERLNPDTMESYRRGRVVFFCWADTPSHYDSTNHG